MSSYMARAAALLGVADPTTNGNGNGSGKLQFVEDALRRPRGIDPLTNKAYPKIDAYECALAIAPALAGRLAWLAGRGWYVHVAGALWAPDSMDAAETLVAERPELEWCSLGTARRAIMAELRGCSDIVRDPALFDANPAVCGLPDGKLLEPLTGRIRAPEAGEFVTRHLAVMPVRYPPGEAVLFEDTLRHTVRSHPDAEAVVAWCRWWFKYAIGGSCDDESLLFLFGAPGTGKSTLADTVAAMLGTYAGTVAAERLVGNSSQHRQWLARLTGRRLVRCNELPSRGASWRTDDLLSMVSGETVEANFMHKGSFEFRSAAHLLLTGNEAPTAPTTSGIWRRLRVVQCDSAPEAVDTGLKARLREPANLAAALWWVLTAPNEQPPVPESIVLAVEEQRSESNPAEAWIDEYLEADPRGTLPTSSIHDHYRSTNGGDFISAQSFGRLLTAAGIASAPARGSDGKVIKIRRAVWAQRD